MKRIGALLLCITVVLLLAVTAVPVGAAAPKDPATGIAVPSVAAWAGYGKLTFYDDFDSLSTIDTKATGKEGFKWYVTRPYGASTLTTEDFSISDSVLTLKERKSTYNYGISTFDCKSGVGFAYQHGYMEIRLKVAKESTKPGVNGSPAVWSLPPETLMDNSTQWVEVDFMEYYSVARGFGTTLHDQVRATKMGDLVQHDSTTANDAGLSDGKWHTMGFLWNKGEFRAYLDGRHYMTRRWWEDDYSDPLPNVVFGQMRVGSFAQLDKQTVPLILSGAAEFPMYVDWVRVWQSGGNLDANRFTPEKFVKTYATGADGKVYTEANEENYKKLLNAQSAWNALSAEEKQGVEVVIANDSARSFECLLSDAAALKALYEPTASSATQGAKKTKTAGSAATQQPTAADTEPETPTAVEGEEETTAAAETETTVATAPEERTFANDNRSWYWAVPLAVVILGGAATLWILGARKQKSLSEYREDDTNETP